eukprot:jgi/Antlo1/148/295
MLEKNRSLSACFGQKPRSANMRHCVLCETVLYLKLLVIYAPLSNN